MPNFGNKYEETINGFGVVCEVCGAEVKSITSVYCSQRSDGRNKSWQHTVKYECGGVIYYRHGHGSDLDYRLQESCGDAHDVALKFKAKVESAQAALTEK